MNEDRLVVKYYVVSQQRQPSNGKTDLKTMLCITNYCFTFHVFSDMLITRKIALITLIPVYLNGVVWAVCPFIGWGQYGPEPFGMSCSLDWFNLSHSYIFTMFAFVFIIPVLVMLFSYTRMVQAVRRAVLNSVVAPIRLDIHLIKVSLYCVLVEI